MLVLGVDPGLLKTGWGLVKFVNGNLTGSSLFINALSSILMIISVIATIFSGIDYIKGGKELLKD